VSGVRAVQVGRACKGPEKKRKGIKLNQGVRHSLPEDTQVKGRESSCLRKTRKDMPEKEMGGRMYGLAANLATSTLIARKKKACGYNQKTLKSVTSIIPKIHGMPEDEKRKEEKRENGGIWGLRGRRLRKQRKVNSRCGKTLQGSPTRKKLILLKSRDCTFYWKKASSEKENLRKEVGPNEIRKDLSWSRPGRGESSTPELRNLLEPRQDTGHLF